MIWCLWLLLNTGATDTPADQTATTAPLESVDEPQPDMELLLFLAEWGDAEDEEWLDPTSLIEDNAMTRELDKENAHEEDKPDHP